MDVSILIPLHFDCKITDMKAVKHWFHYLIHELLDSENTAEHACMRFLTFWLHVLLPINWDNIKPGFCYCILCYVWQVRWVIALLWLMKYDDSTVARSNRLFSYIWGYNSRKPAHSPRKIRMNHLILFIVLLEFGQIYICMKKTLEDMVHHIEMLVRVCL